MMTRSVVRLLLASSVMFACGCGLEVTPPTVPPPPSPGAAPRDDIPIRVDVPPEVPDRYRWVYEGFPTRDSVEAARRALPFEEITLARQGCFGVCPIYTVTFRADGTATYVGKSFVPRVGRFSGEPGVGVFARLSLLIERAGFMDLAERYAAPSTDQETIITTVSPRGGLPKSVLDYGQFGPPDLWGLERAIIGLVEEVRWRPD